MNRPVGHYITYFQNFDYLKKWYRENHSTNRVSDQHINQIISCFRQGDQYFGAASKADEIVRPLLLYYGVLSYVRGVILAKDNLKTEAQLLKAHGLKEEGWENVFTEEDNSNKSILDLGIRASKGTFKEFVSTVEHEEMFKFQTLAARYVGYMNRPLGEVKFAKDRSVLTLGDILARLPATCEDYGQLDSQERQWCQVTATQLSGGVFTFDASGASVPKWYSSQANEINQRRNETEPKSLIKGCLSDVDFPKVILETSKPNIGSSWAVSNFPNGDKLSEFLKLYLGSYILGMLVRYFPSQWMKMQSPFKGDFAMPLIYALIGSIEKGFPKEVERVLGLRHVSDDF
ncbi:YaaC family protein [Pseudovibrio sp. POLY-S9]|uniref:YaaC family protein n=1 Tax=Pseudovibrio sp. POLY-S9 TaxID=1576596 RepID=UPI00071080E9|nr:YaaC family protein [Pseudovibrio sp. POLY-S9]